MSRKSELAQMMDRIYAAMNRGDLEAALEELDPDIEWVDPPDLPDRRAPIRGRQALKEVWLQYLELFSDTIRYEILEFEQAGERTFVALRIAVTGRGSGAPAAADWYQVGFLGVDDKPVRFENYSDRASALEAAGLSP
jgi:ketosteroid isomerase-like protein